MREVLIDPDRTDDFRAARRRAVPHGDRPRHVRADRLRRRRLGRRADLDRRARLDRAADGLRARQGPRPRAHRRRHRLDDEPRHRRRGGREVRRGRQPARARTSTTSPKTVPTLPARARGTCQRHGLPADRLPGVQADGLPAPARDGAPVGAALPGRRHRPDRARARRRADVPDVDHELHLAGRHRAPRLRVGDDEARRRLRALPGGLRAPRHRDLRDARAQGRQALRAPETEKTRAWRKILEQTTGALLRQSASD